MSGPATAPAKALAVVPQAELRVGADGVAEDRRLFLVTDSGSLVAPRTFPALASVRPDLDPAAGRLMLTFPDGQRLDGPIPPTGPIITSGSRSPQGHARPDSRPGSCFPTTAVSFERMM
ncbi:MOSC N-terminal beta barrel domain-containing protein [Frankia gtarii]|uniref:MOSC N-terminal beta barrel domain-containing protein n=1 Tax=Frankia gtarii TaxID=2950102 RepID=UPI0034D60705